MVTVASYTSIRNVELKMEKLLLPVILSFTIANLSVLLYFNEFVFDLGNLLEARHLIPIGSLILGNSLRGNIVGKNLTRISAEMKTDTFTASLGASRYEALMPYTGNAFTPHSGLRSPILQLQGLSSFPG